MDYNTEIILSKLFIKNFKGINSLSLDTANDNLTIYGDNGTGKTSIYDAFLWCLFDKDSTGKSAFEVRPIKDDEIQHRIETEVILTLLVNEKEVEFKRTAEEKWVKRRGQTEEELSGMSYSYFVNSVSYTKTKFSSFISNIIDEQTFRRLTSADHFFQLSKTDMRSLLISMCGDVPEEDLISAEPMSQIAFSVMKKKGYSVEQLDSVLKSEKKKLNSELNQIPARIDEASRNIPKRIDTEEVEALIAKEETELADIDHKLQLDKDTYEKSREIAKKIAGLEHFIEEKKNQIKRDHQEKRLELVNIIKESNKFVEEQHKEIRDLENRIKVAANLEAEGLKKLEDLRTRYIVLKNSQTEVNAKRFLGLQEDARACPTCGQALTPVLLKKYEKDARNTFVKQKELKLKDIKDDMDEITKRGFKAKEQVQKYKDLIETSKSEIEEIKTKVRAISDESVKVSGELSTMPEQIEEELLEKIANDDKDIRDAKKELARFEKQETSSDDVIGLINQKTEIITRVSELKKELDVNSAADEAEQRIEELKEMQRQLSSHLAKVEKIQDSLIALNKAKADILVDKINSMFSYVQFRLVKQNMNGNYDDDCEPLINGVPYSTNASRSEKIRAGMDVVRAMQQHEGISAPLFIDNAESLTWFIKDMNCQIIKMYVSEKDKLLRWE